MLLLLLDADVIIDLHRLGAWEKVTQSQSVSIPSIILRQEAYYYKDYEGNRHSIDLEQEIGKSIQEVSCTAEELSSFIDNFDKLFQQELHPGEKEALVLLQKNEEFVFSTCDHAAIKTLALLDLSHQGISVEKLLKKSGITKSLERKHTEEYFKSCLREGSAMRIQDRGLVKKKGRKKTEK